MTTADTGLRVGLDGVSSRAVAVDRQCRIAAVHRGQRADSPMQLLHALFERGIDPTALDRVVALTPEVTLAESTQSARVGVLRIGAPAATAVPPLAGWPAEQAPLAGPVAMVQGGHEYDGRVAAPLDMPAVAAFARKCVGTVDAVALAAINALENPEHEQLAAAVIADELGPDVPVVRGAETEALGLLERENTAVLDAALAQTARVHIDELHAVVRAHAPDAALYVVRGDGTVLPEFDAHRHGTAWLGAAPGALLHGAAALAGVRSAIVVEVMAGRAVVGTTVGGLLRDSGLPHEVDGIRTGLRVPRRTIIHRTHGEFAQRVLAAIRRAQGRPDELPIVMVGDRAEEVPNASDIAAIRPDDGDLAAAVGAAAAEAAGSVDRIFWQGAGGRQESVARARRMALDAALRAGADPRRLRETPVREGLMTYAPVPAARLQATAVGPLLESTALAVNV